MKNSTSYVISGVLAAALIVLYILFFTSKSPSSMGVGARINSSDSTFSLPIAYVKMDSLLINYNYAKDLNEALMRKEEGARATLNQKQKQVQSAAQEFERLRQNNAFLSTERAQQEYERIMKMQQDYQQTAEKLTQEFALEQQKVNFQLEDTIKVRLGEYNKDRRYEIIFTATGTDNILLAEKKYDITREVISFLNKKYGPATAAAAAEKK